MKTFTEVVDAIETLLQDAGIDPGGSANQVFAAAEIENFMPEGITKVSRARPYQEKHTLTTDGTTRNLTLTAAEKKDLLEIPQYEGLEYPVSQYYQSFHNHKRFGDTLTMMIDALPAAGQSVYLYLRKRHILQKEIGTTDTAGAIKTQAAAGATSLSLKLLGTGTINENTILTLSGTSYLVISTATIAAAEATVLIWPGLAAQAAADTVITLSLHESTLDNDLEESLIKYVAASCAVSKARLSIGQQSFGKETPVQLINWGLSLKQETERRLNAIRDISIYKEYSLE
jgi:hypothetical protein